MIEKTLTIVLADGELIGDDIEKDKQRFTVTETGIVVIPQGYLF